MRIDRRHGHVAIRARSRRRTRRSRKPGPCASPTRSAGSDAAVALLTTTWPALARAFHVGERADRGAGEQQLAVRVADEEALERAGVHAGRHAQHDAPGGGVEPADVGEPGLHAERGAGGPLGVAGAGEEEEQRVAAELQEAAAGLVRDLEQRLEAGADRVGHLFGADLAVAGQALGHLGEARRCRRRAASRRRPGAVRSGAEVGPVDGQPGDVREQRPVRIVRFPVLAASVPLLRTCTRSARTRPEARRISLPAGNAALRRASRG